MRQGDRETIRKAALNEFGKRHWRGIVYGPMVAKILAPLVLLAAAVGGLAWAWHAASTSGGPHVHAPSVSMPSVPPWLWMTPVAAGVVALAVLAWRRSGVRYRLPVRPMLVRSSRWR